MSGFLLATLDGEKRLFYVDEGRQIEVEPTEWDKRRKDGVYDENWNLLRIRDTFREEDHPRDPKGTPTGGQFTSKNATPAPAKPKGPTTDELLAKENKGTTKERVDMRRALKTGIQRRGWPIGMLPCGRELREVEEDGDAAEPTEENE